MTKRSLGKKVVILSAVFLLAAVVGLFWTKNRDAGKQDRAGLRLLDCDPANVSRVELIQSGPSELPSKIVLDRTDKASEQVYRSKVLDLIRWQMAEPKGVEADSGRVTKMVGMLCEMFSIERLSPSERDTVSFDGVAVRLVDKEGEKRELLFSSKLVQGRGFVRVKKSGDAYAVPESLFRIVSAPAEAFANRRVARILPGNVLAVKVWDGHEEFVELERSDSGWILKRGGKTLGNGSDGADQYVNRIINLLALEVIAESCKSGTSDFRLDVDGISGRHEELSFRSVKNGFIACSSDRKETFRVHKDIAKYLRTPVKKLM